MYCEKCGSKLEEVVKGKLTCPKCGNSQEETKSNNGESKKKRIKVDIGDVINTNDVLSATNKVAYIAKGWALQVRNRGQNFAILAFIGYLIWGFILQGNASYMDDAPYWLIYAIYGIIAAVIIIAIFNTTAFIIRMGAEVIQLLDDIKHRKEDK